MNKVKEAFNKALDWQGKEVPYTNGDALLLLAILIYTLIK